MVIASVRSKSQPTMADRPKIKPGTYSKEELKLLGDATLSQLSKQLGQEQSDEEPLFKSRIGDATFSALSKEFPATKSKIGDATLSALSKEFSVWRLRRGL